VTKTLPEFRQKFRLDELTVHETAHWVWSVRLIYCTLGAGVLSLKRFCPRFGEITCEEAADLQVMTKHIESRLVVAFGAEKFNYLMLMMVDDHLHCHVLPRYSQPQQFGGLEWVDSVWPKPPATQDYAERAGLGVLADIRDRLK
jgi:diadenosine tetraphosphate (Ap4A) HIT family hydrolase